MNLQIKAMRSLTLILSLGLACSLDGPAATAQTQPGQTPPRRTPPRTTPARPQTTPPQPAQNPPAQPEQVQPEQAQPHPADNTQPAPQPVQEPPVPGSELIGRDETGRIKIDPDLQRKIDDMLQQDEARRAAEGQSPPADPSGAQPPSTTPTTEPPKSPAQRAAERRRAAQQRDRGADGPVAQPGAQPVPGSQPISPPIEPSPSEPAGPSTVLQIEPELEPTPVPLEERRFGFSIKNGTYEQLIKGFAHQTGLGVLGEAPRDGTVTFETSETLSFREALSRIRMLLFNYKPHEPYWILHEGTHLRVIRVTDLYRILPLERMFPSMAALQQANLPDDEIVLVVYTPESGSLSELRQVRDFLPDYVRMTPMEDGVSVSIFALVSDIKKYMEIKEVLIPERRDPRVTERFDVQNIAASEAVNRLRQLADLDNVGGVTQPVRGVRGAAPREPSAIDQVRDPAVILIPDDAQGYFLVRGMRDKVEEIRKLLPFVDVSIASASFAPVVVPVKNADAGDLVNAIQQVLTASAPTGPGGVPVPAAPSPRRTRRPAGGGASAAVPVSADSITLLPHPTRNAILVMADEAGVERVRELVAMFDVKSVIGPIRIQLEVADASEVVSTVSQVLGGGGGGAPGAKAAAAPESFQLVPDPSGSLIWYSGSEADLEQVQALIVELDVAGKAPKLHIVRLVYQQPSFVADILRQLDGASPQSAEPAAAGRTPKTRRVVKTGSVSKFTPDDPQKKLFILCTDDDFARYQEIIATLDQPEDQAEMFDRVPVQHLDSTTAVNKLAEIMASTRASQDIRMIAVDGSILLLGASPYDVDIVKTMLAEIDKPSQVEQRTFVIKYADPADIKTAIEALVPAGGSSGSSPAASRRRARPRPAGAEGGPAPAAEGAAADATVTEQMTIFQIGNKLVVKATPVVLDQVAEVVAQFDVEGAGSDMRVYSDFPPNSDIVGITETLSSVFAGSSGRGARGARATAVGGPRFIPQPASNRLVVMAEPAEFGEIERLLDVLKVEAVADPYLVEFVDVEHADPATLVEEIQPLLDIKIRGLVEAGELTDPNVESAAPTTVPRPGRARRLQQGGGGSDRYHIAPDSGNQRIVVAAPQRIIDEVRRLIEQFDVPATRKNIVMRTVDLVNATPADMVKAVKEMMGKPSSGPLRRPTTKVSPTAPGAPAASPLEGLGGDSLTVMESPGGTGVLLRGPEKDVEEATEWIHQLDAMSTRGRAIKLYQLKTADPEKIFDLIVSVVDVQGGGRAGVAAGARGPVGKGAKEEKDEFATSRTHASADTYMHADFISDTILVATTPAKLTQIDDLVNQFETDKTLATSIERTAVPKFYYKLKYAEAEEAMWDLEDLLEKDWDHSSELPKVEDLTEDTLVIRYPDESKFEEIRALIREHIDKATEKETKTVRKSFVPPPGLSPEAAVRWLRQKHPDWTFEEIDLGQGKEIPTFGIEQVGPLDQRDNGNGATPSNGNPIRSQGDAKKSSDGRVQALPARAPWGFQPVVDALAAALLAQTPPEEEPAPEEPAEEAPLPDDEPVYEEPPLQPMPAQPDFSEQMLRNVTRQLMQPKDQDSTTGEEKEDRPKEERKKKGSAKLIWDNIQGVYLIEADQEDLEELETSLEDLEEEQEGIWVPPDIRIYRVRYIDVFTAQDIIEEMFNATKAMQQQFNVQQQQMQQMQRLQQMQQQRQQQQQQQTGRQPEGKDGRPAQPNQQQQAQQMPQLQVAQLPAPAVRVYPNPRDRTLILRAETSQYPHILELLATIDQPRPVDSKTRSYQLKRVSATEMEQMLRETLRLDEAGARPRTARTPGVPGAGGAAGPLSSPGGALPETILQETFTGNLLGVDPQDITLFSSETANTIMAVAPPAALDYIGQLIEQFESGDIPERLTRFYQLLHAPAVEVATQLEEYFAAKNPQTSGARPRRGGSGDGPASSASAGGGLNTPSFIPYERLNQITVHATQEQLTEIEDILKRLDVSSEEEEWQHVPIVHADPKLVADTLTEMFGGTGTGAGRSSSGRPAAGGQGGSAGGAKFIGEPGGRMVLFSAPKARHPEILNTIATIEERSKQSAAPRVIELKNATPSQVAEAIEKAYDPRRTGQQGGAQRAPRFTVTAHDPTRRLFVVADDDMFAQINSLINTLDVPVPGGGFGAEFRIYPLQYANARAVHSQMTKLMTEYVQRLGADAKKLEAFSVQPDDTANALVVLGTPSVFGFIEENLRKIDTPASKATQPDTYVVDLKNADADGVARALNEIFVRSAAKSPDGEAPITISAVPGSRALLVRANAVDYARIQTAIAELDTEEVAHAGEVRVITVNFGDATEIKAALESYLKKPAGAGARGEQLIGDVRLAVMPQTNAIMISGASETLDRLEGIARGMDIAGEKGSAPQIIPLKFASAALVVPALRETFSDPKFGGGRKNYAPPVIVADEGSNALIVRAAPQELAAIESFVAKLDIEGKMDKSGPRIVQVAVGVNVEDLAEQVAESVNESAKARMGNAKGATVPSIIAIPNLRTNTITLAGSGMLFDEAEAMIKTLEGMGPAGGKATAVIGPKNIATQDLQRLIEQLTQQQSGGGGRRGGSGGGQRQPRGNR